MDRKARNYNNSNTSRQDESSSMQRERNKNNALVVAVAVADPKVPAAWWGGHVNEYHRATAWSIIPNRAGGGEAVF